MASIFAAWSARRFFSDSVASSWSASSFRRFSSSLTSAWVALRSFMALARERVASCTARFLGSTTLATS